MKSTFRPTLTAALCLVSLQFASCSSTNPTDSPDAVSQTPTNAFATGTSATPLTPSPTHTSASSTLTAPTVASTPTATEALPSTPSMTQTPWLDPTVGLVFEAEGHHEGYVLFSPISDRSSFLVDSNGREINRWTSFFPVSLTAYLDEEGRLVRASNIGAAPGTGFQVGGAGGAVEVFGWDGTREWLYTYSTSEYRLHHDIEPLPGGNVLMIAWEYRSPEEVIEAGFDPSGLPPEGDLWPEHIIEVAPTGATSGTIVWEWHAWDHLVQDHDPSKSNYGVPSEHPELINVGYPQPHLDADFLHFNSIDYEPERDLIVVSVAAAAELWVIDHSTTTQEAAGHTGGAHGRGGDILYRWGNPSAYGVGNRDDKVFFGAHDARWVESGSPGEGNLTIFNNGAGRDEGEFATVVEITPPTEENGAFSGLDGDRYGPSEEAWVYPPGGVSELEAIFWSGAHRLASGNTLISNGPAGTLVEVTTEGETVWRYINPVIAAGVLEQGDEVPLGLNGLPQNNLFRAAHYRADFAGFVGRDLTPGAPIESGQ